jgi:poly(3-hydroxyalkanoate) synthetase
MIVRVKEGERVLVEMTHWPDLLSPTDFAEFTTAVLLTLANNTGKQLVKEVQHG